MTYEQYTKLLSDLHAAEPEHCERYTSELVEKLVPEIGAMITPMLESSVGELSKTLESVKQRMTESKHREATLKATLKETQENLVKQALVLLKTGAKGLTD